MMPLFDQYPGVRQHIHRVPLGNWPTPVQRMPAIERGLGGPALHIKRDDLSSTLYGGNKVRNLEFLLGRALYDRKQEVLTFGTAGSNQGLATALYAKQVGLRSISMLLPQPNARYVRENLLLSHQAGAELHYHSNALTTAIATLYQLARHRMRTGASPQLIPPGGSSPLGMVGFVNAALELKQQVEAGEMPEPDYLYAPLGTMGTVIGLLLGFRLAGLDTRVVGVRVTAPQYSSVRKARRFFLKTNALLHEADPDVPLLPFPEDHFTIRHEFYGEDYAQYTPESVDTALHVKKAEAIQFEGTYTGKAFAAVIADAHAGALDGKTVLFWHTANTRDLAPLVEGLDYRALPQPFRQYFEQPVQPLDEQLRGGA
ncbi:MAG TPA: pyridoxal-phosphate dependent enzyme [Candidatus Hydrogenedentes bacterium]|nr:pyridoxal-phosphate dependent enzyme [Candidatus Hydrogenedentota bacterium]